VTRAATSPPVSPGADAALAAGFAQAVVATAPLIIVLLDPRGLVQFANAYFATTSGFSAEEIRGKDWFATFLPEQDRPLGRAR
jgi:PAS domain S-box-containing protein